MEGKPNQLYAQEMRSFEQYDEICKYFAEFIFIYLFIYLMSSIKTIQLFAPLGAEVKI